LIERKNLTVQGSFSHNWPVWEKAIKFVDEGKIKISPLITHRLGIEKWKEAFDLCESRKGVKVLLTPS
jgi:alcohol dehydrogenase/L-iditol 2-dehydrogenase